MRPSQKPFPELRFPEFSKEWAPCRLKKLFRERNERPDEPLPLYSLTIEAGVVPKTERYERSFLVKSQDDAYKVMHPDDFAFNPMNLRFGALARHRGEGKITVSKYYNIFYCTEGIDPVFAEHLLTTENIIQFYNKMSTGSLDEKRRVHFLDFLEFEFRVAGQPEQKRIAAFLSALDRKIGQLDRKKTLLVQYKKGVMQQIFNRHVRFKDGSGKNYADWETKSLNNYLSESRIRNTELAYGREHVLSVSKDPGIVNQIEHLGRSYAGASVRDYHVVKTGAIVYTKSPLKNNPYGIIKVNKGEPGIVSTLYAVYECKDNVSGQFLDYFFQLDDNTNRYLRPLVRKGAKNDLKVNNTHVLTGLISVPSKPEQLAIVRFLAAIDQKISIANRQLQLTRAFKRGLLQRMFV